MSSWQRSAPGARGQSAKFARVVALHRAVGRLRTRASRHRRLVLRSRAAATRCSCSTAGRSGRGRRGTRGRGGRRSCGTRASVRTMPWLASVFSSTASASSGLEEARPAGARLELRVGREQRRAAAHAHVGAVVVAVPVLAGERPLGAGLAGDLVLLGRQPLTPLVVGLRELVFGDSWPSDPPWFAATVNARPTELVPGQAAIAGPVCPRLDDASRRRPRRRRRADRPVDVAASATRTAIERRSRPAADRGEHAPAVERPAAAGRRARRRIAGLDAAATPCAVAGDDRLQPASASDSRNARAARDESGPPARAGPPRTSSVSTTPGIRARRLSIGRARSLEPAFWRRRSAGAALRALLVEEVDEHVVAEGLGRREERPAAVHLHHPLDERRGGSSSPRA